MQVKIKRRETAKICHGAYISAERDKKKWGENRERERRAAI